MIDPDEVAELRAQRKLQREPDCQCDGETVGPCPGPLNCPYSGLAPEDTKGRKNDLETDRKVLRPPAGH